MAQLVGKVFMLELHHKQKLVCCRFPQDARDDVGGAQTAGMLGILVRTGKNKLFIISSATCHGICVCIYIDGTPYCADYCCFVTSQVNTGKEMRIKSTLLLISRVTVSRMPSNTS